MRFVVFGSAHLDMLSCIHDGVDDAVIDSPGDLRISYGGTGLNIASNLAKLGHQVLFLTGLARSSISQMIMQSLRHAGIDVRVEFRDDLPDAGFSAHIRRHEMISSVSSCPVEMIEFPSHHIDAALTQCDAVIADCNLSRSSLSLIAERASTRGLSFWLAAVSEPKSTKVLFIKERGQRLSGLFINRREMSFLLQRAGYASQDMLASFLRCSIVETRGADGVVVWPADGGPPAERCVKDSTLDQPIGGPSHQRHFLASHMSRIIEGASYHWLGAGDRLLAETLHRHFEYAEHLSKAAAIASQSITASYRGQACNPLYFNPIEERMSHLTRVAFRDALTGLLNRAGAEDALEQMDYKNKKAKRLVLMMLDVDFFKKINDTFGHASGDVVLKEIGRLVIGALRPSDIAYRFGGEEIAILLPGETVANGALVAERLRDMIARHVFVLPETNPIYNNERLAAAALAKADLGRVRKKNQRTGENALYRQTADVPGVESTITVTCSIGVSGGSFEKLKQIELAADNALYQAKEQGRNRVIVATPAFTRKRVAAPSGGKHRHPI